MEDQALAPGRYEFRYFNSYFGDVGDEGQYDIRPGFATVAEPLSMVFVLVGGVVLALRRRR